MTDPHGVMQLKAVTEPSAAGGRTPGRVMMSVSRAQMKNGGSYWNVPKLTDKNMRTADCRDPSGGDSKLH